MTWPKNPSAILATFAIGLTAGVAPFLFMQLLPAMLNPDVAAATPNYWAIILTGGLIGAITSIVFASKFDQTEPREIFFYALGVPAVLIATTTNISAEFKADRRIAEVQEQATSTILSPGPVPEVIDQEPKPLTPARGDTVTGRLVPALWIGDTAVPEGVGAAQGESYFVVIGEYGTSAQAWADYRRFQNLRLRTERYVQKNLGVYEVRAGLYILAYARYTSEADARRAHQLLRINDPDLPVRILKYTAARSANAGGERRVPKNS